MKSRGGFTLIELSLSLIFIAILSLTVVLLIQNISASYRRGLILNQVNTVGMDLVDDFRISIQNASSDPVTRMCEIYYYEYDSANRQSCVEDGGMSFVSVTKRANVKVGNDNIGEMPVYGALCTGTYTYIWNTGYFENADGYEGDINNERKVLLGGSELPAAVLGTKASGTASFIEKYSDFRLLKVYDGERTICVNAMREQNGSWDNLNYKKSTDYDNNKIGNEFVISEQMLQLAEADEDVVDLMKKHDAADLVLYELYFSKPALSATRQNLFYAASFILGTRRGGINIKEAGESCKPPSDDFSELEYCAINKFNFAVMAGGGK